MNNYKNKADENLKILLDENDAKKLLIKRIIKGFITGIAVFIIVYLIMNI